MAILFSHGGGKWKISVCRYTVLFYTGKRRPYPYSTRWLDEFGDPALAGRLYSSAFPLVDVTVIPDDEIASHRRWPP